MLSHSYHLARDNPNGVAKHDFTGNMVQLGNWHCSPHLLSMLHPHALAFLYLGYHWHGIAPSEKSFIFFFRIIAVNSYWKSISIGFLPEYLRLHNLPVPLVEGIMLFLPSCMPVFNHILPSTYLLPQWKCLTVHYYNLGCPSRAILLIVLQIIYLSILEKHLLW